MNLRVVPAPQYVFRKGLQGQNLLSEQLLPGGHTLSMPANHSQHHAHSYKEGRIKGLNFTFILNS